MFPVSHIHPLLVHFPIALIVTGFALEVLSYIYRGNKLLNDGALWLLIIGAVMAVPAYLSGLFLTGEETGVFDDLRENHELWGGITLFISIITSALYLVYHTGIFTKGWMKMLTTVMYLMTVIALTITGYYGGMMVHE